MPTALITGAGGGIGSAIATALAHTYSLLLAGRASPRLDAVAQRLQATTVPLDLSDADAIRDATGSIDEVDVLVHNAGVSIPSYVADSRIEDWRATFDVNVFGAVTLTLALLPVLRRARGHVVFINSGSGRNVSPGMASYSASKFALRSFAESLGQDEPALRVTTIYPGRTDTGMQHELVAFEGGEYDPAKFLRPETVAAAVANAVATPADGDLHEIVLRPR